MLLQHLDVMHHEVLLPGPNKNQKLDMRHVQMVVYQRAVYLWRTVLRVAADHHKTPLKLIGFDYDFALFLWFITLFTYPYWYGL